MTALFEISFLIAYLGVVIWIAKTAGRTSPVFWIAAAVAYVGYGALQWQEYDRDLRIAERDRAHVAEVRK